jgi:uncharacterized protein (TIGR02246 family)
MNRQQAIVAALIIVLSFSLVSISHTASSNATVEERLQKLEDTEAIRSLLIDYGRALDQRDFKAYGQLFASDGVWKGGMGSATSPERIQKMVEDGFSRMSPDLYEDSHHVMTSLDIEVDGDTARTWSRWLWVVEGPDGKPRAERAGHYEDTLVREDGQWKFKHRQAFTEINK